MYSLDKRRWTDGKTILTITFELRTKGYTGGAIAFPQKNYFVKYADKALLYASRISHGKYLEGRKKTPSF